ncbi:MAG TPA: MFS transporter [Stellaceae bacterium]
MAAPSPALAPDRWLRLVPVAFITYSLAYLDRANYGFGAAAGMAKDLGISGETGSLLGGLFFLGYFFFQIPGAHYAEKHSAKRLIFWGLIAWGILASATGLITNIPLLMADRFLLGVVESVVLPGMLVFLSHWFTRAERSRANTFLILGNPVTVLWMSVVSGYLIRALDWRSMFVVEGAPSIIWAFIFWRLVDDRPTDADWLPPAEGQRLEQLLRDEQRGLPPMRTYREAFASSSVILLSAQYFCWSIGVYGFVIWLPSMLKASSTLGIVAVGWLAAAPYLLATLLMVATSWASDRSLARKVFVWPFLLLGAIAFFGSYLLGTHDFWLSFALLVIAGGAMYAPYGPFFAIVPELLPRNVAGPAMALINSFGALGSFIGSYIVGVLNAATGSDAASYLFMAVALLASAGLIGAVKERSRAHRLSEGSAQLG